MSCLDVVGNIYFVELNMNNINALLKYCFFSLNLAFIVSKVPISRVALLKYFVQVNSKNKKKSTPPPPSHTPPPCYSPE